MSTIRKALVVGGGIGGLATAIGLAQRGIEVELVEINKTWVVYHVGIIVQANFVRALGALGLADAAIAAGCEGIVSKRGDSRYRSGDTRSWVKIKPPEVRERQAEAIRKGFERAARRRGVKA